ncbi:MAG: DUF2255 family protein [Bacteroidota bacterium]
MPFPNDFIQFLHQHTLVGIKGGEQRKTFLDIWMVEVGGRVFARSWSKSERSWFTAFQQESFGEIRYGKSILRVKGIKLSHDPNLSDNINQAYLTKYTQEQNIRYAQGITQPEYVDYTMEFFFLEKKEVDL